MLTNLFALLLASAPHSTSNPSPSDCSGFAMIQQGVWQKFPYNWKFAGPAAILEADMVSFDLSNPDFSAGPKFSTTNFKVTCNASMAPSFHFDDKRRLQLVLTFADVPDTWPLSAGVFGVSAFVTADGVKTPLYQTFNGSQFNSHTVEYPEICGHDFVLDGLQFLAIGAPGTITIRSVAFKFPVSDSGTDQCR